MKGLNKVSNNNGSICFSYTPLDTIRVHNANLMMIEHLLWTYLLTSNKKLLEIALKALHYTIDEIKDDGSLCYYGSTETCWQDYHIGYLFLVSYY